VLACQQGKFKEGKRKNRPNEDRGGLGKGWRAVFGGGKGRAFEVRRGTNLGGQNLSRKRKTERANHNLGMSGSTRGKRGTFALCET